MATHCLNLSVGTIDPLFANGDYRDFCDIKKDIDSFDSEDLIVICGNSPCLHPNFFSILNHVKNKLIFNVVIISDGHFFVDNNNFDKLLDFRFVNFFVPIVSLNKNIHNLHFSNLDKSLIFISTLLSMNFKIFSLIPLLEDNILSLSATCFALNNLNIKDIVLYLPSISDNVPDISDVKGIILNLLQNHNFMLYLDNLSHCAFPSHLNHYSSFLKFDNSKSSLCSSCSFNNKCKGFPSDYLNKKTDYEIKLFLEVNKNTNSLQRIVDSLRNKTKIFVSYSDIFYFINKIKENSSLWSIIENSGFPIPYCILILKELEKENFVKINNNSVELIFNIPKINISTYSNFRLSEDFSLSQLNICDKDVLSRVKHIIQTLGPDRSIAILGDDDFVSLALASSGLFRKIIVFDIDKRIVDKINSLASKNNFPLEAFVHDLKNPFAKNIKHSFDAFYTDTPYTNNGFKLFVSRGIQLLKNKPYCFGFVSFSPENPLVEDVELPCQHIFSSMNLFCVNKGCSARNQIPSSFKNKYPSFDSINKALADHSNLSDLESWYFAALGRKEYLFTFASSEITHPLIFDKFTDELYYIDDPLTFYINNQWDNISGNVECSISPLDSPIKTTISGKRIHFVDERDFN